MKLDISRLNNIDLTKIIYPITIFLTGFYIIANLYRLPTEWNWAPPMIAYTIAWTLVPIGFAYLALKRVRLKFKWSVLSVIGIILIVVFSLEAIGSFPGAQLSDIFLTGIWDHTFFPIAFGFFFLCDLNELPKRFWLLLLPFALFNIIPNFFVVANVFFNSNILQDIGAPGFFVFFGVSSWEELHALSNQEFIQGLTGYLTEQLTFFSLFPVVIIYHIFRKQKHDLGV